MDYYRIHDDEAEEIAKNSYETFARRYLTPAAVSLSGHQILERYTKLFRSPATGDASSGLGHRSKAMNHSSMHRTSRATW
jgi:flavoprotein